MNEISRADLTGEEDREEAKRERGRMRGKR